MLIVIGRAEADAKDLADVRDALGEMMRKTWEEPGCLSYSLSVEHEGDGAAPAVISIAERWEDMESLKAHFGMVHMTAFNRRIAGRIRNLDVHLYEVARELPLPGAA